jgi:hypothetical protein
MATLTKDQISVRLIDYFAGRFGDDPLDYTGATDAKKRHRFPDAAWEDLADTLSQLLWCVAIGGHIGQEQMATRTRIGQLAKCIFDSTRAVAKKPAKTAAKKVAMRPTAAAAGRGRKVGKKSPKRKVPGRTSKSGRKAKASKKAHKPS